jgi:hypothetical protein
MEGIMTTKQISEAVGKDERTIQRWARRTGDKLSSIGDKLSSVKQTGRPADYTLDETMAIIETGLGKNAAAVWKENASRAKSGPDVYDIAAIVRETVASMVPVLIAAVRGAVPERAVASLPAPSDISMRDQLRQVVNRYASASGDHRGAWSNLYSDFYYRYHRNLRECAKNRGVDTLDYAEDEGLLPDLLSLALSMYGAAA